MRSLSLRAEYFPRSACQNLFFFLGDFSSFFSWSTSMSESSSWTSSSGFLENFYSCLNIRQVFNSYYRVRFINEIIKNNWNVIDSLTYWIKQYHAFIHEFQVTCHLIIVTLEFIQELINHLCANLNDERFILVNWLSRYN